jgi:3-methyl-2-oxobutanoate hydroxymethyltransferase
LLARRFFVAGSDLANSPTTDSPTLTERIAPPTIGIGASVACDGQILVADDMIGLFTEFQAKFVRRYAAVAQAIEAAISDYASDVRARRFPAPEHVFAETHS